MRKRGGLRGTRGQGSFLLFTTNYGRTARLALVLDQSYVTIPTIIAIHWSLLPHHLEHITHRLPLTSQHDCRLTCLITFKNRCHSWLYEVLNKGNSAETANLMWGPAGLCGYSHPLRFVFPGWIALCQRASRLEKSTPIFECHTICSDKGAAKKVMSYSQCAGPPSSCVRRKKDQTCVRQEIRMQST